jgi:hypothetical protein
MRLSTPSDYATPTLVRDVVEYFVHEKFAFENWCFIISLEQNWVIKGTIGLFRPYLITIKNKLQALTRPNQSVVVYSACAVCPIATPPTRVSRHCLRHRHLLRTVFARCEHGYVCRWNRPWVDFSRRNNLMFHAITSYFLDSIKTFSVCVYHVSIKHNSHKQLRDCIIF